MSKKIQRVLQFIGVVALLLAAHVNAQEAYPSRSVRMIVPFAPGGPADLIARIVSQKLSEQLGKPFVIENHPGANGNIGTGIALRAQPDGYTLVFNSQSIVVSKSLYKSLPYGPGDWVAITRVASTPNVLIVNPSVPATNVRELVELIKGGGDKYHAYAQPGFASPSHLSAELFRLSQQLTLNSVPFNGGGPMVLSVVAGHTLFGFTSMPPAASHIRAGGLRALAVTAERRSESLPDVPTMAEAGFADQIGDTPIGIFAPAKTPKDIVEFLQRTVSQILRTTDVKRKLLTIGFEGIGDSPAEFAAYLKSEDIKWSRVIREAGIKLD